VSISIDYRLLGDRGTLPSQWLQHVQDNFLPENRDQVAAMYPAARDAKAAVRWLYANAATYQINTDYVTAMGGSAGAYLAITLGVSDPADFRDEVPASADPTLATLGGHRELCDTSGRVASRAGHAAALPSDFSESRNSARTSILEAAGDRESCSAS